MAKASYIIAQLIAALPKLTDLFSDSFDVSSLTRSGSTITAITSSAHNFNTGDYVNIVGAQAPVLVTSLTRVGNIVTGVTANQHDLTEGFQDTIIISGAVQAEYNGASLKLLTVPNRNTFTYQISGTPISPATGTILLFDGKERGYNGRFQVTVIDSTTFTYSIDPTLTPYSPAIGSIYARGKVRVSGAISADRANDSYTVQDRNKLWAFVVLKDNDGSKDRNILNDGKSNSHPGQDGRMVITRRFSVFIFCPATFEIAGRNSRDLMEDVEVYLFRSLLNFKPPHQLFDQTQWGVTFEKSELFSYNTAYSIYEFAFQIRSDITYKDGIDPDINVAFRDVLIQIQNSINEQVTAGVNLDDEPA